jgi:O-antigen ligase
MLGLAMANPLLLALPTLAALSSAWAPEPMVALRRAGAFAATMMAGIAVVTALPGAATLRFMMRTAAAGVALSVAYVVLTPSYGVHQVSDGVQSVHAGDWRGLFLHRTALGQLAALTLAVTAYEGGAAFKSLGLRAMALAACAVCLVMARSGGGWVSATLLLALPGGMGVVERVYRRGGLALAVGAAVLAAVLAWLLAPWLLSLLGKDATLTGRTSLWSLMLQLAAERPLFGYGYSTGFRDVVAERLAAQSLFGYVPNAQNGYLDVVLNLGLVGLALALATMVIALRRALRLATSAQPRGPYTRAPLLIVVFIMELNGIEAALISANDIFVLIYAATVAATGEMTKRG